MRHKYVISIGSNCENAASKVVKALKFLTQLLSECRCSSIYSTPSIKNDGTYYYNAVAIGLSEFTVENLNEVLKEYESREGRMHAVLTVEIDLDIIMVDGCVLRPKDFQRSYFRIGFDELE